MDKLKGAAKGGWDKRPIHRDTFSKDGLKGIATGKKADPYESARNHQSTPLQSLKDPSSFAPPPKHSAYYPNAQSPTTTGVSASTTSGGLGSPVPAPSRQRQQQLAQQEAEENRAPPEPYRKDTTGLRTDNLPKPPVRRANGGATAGSPVVRTSSPSLPPRQNAPPSLPTRQGSHPPPSLPPRMTENPSEFDPPPPPTYHEATAQPEAGHINQQAVSRLSQAGVSVPGFGIGGAQQPASPSQQGHGGQLSELQQRFSRMNAGNGPSTPVPSALTPGAAASAAVKKAPPPPPKKKSSLVTGDSPPQSSDGSALPTPPPVPMSSKPRAG